jgi:hypothetical protein
MCWEASNVPAEHLTGQLERLRLIDAATGAQAYLEAERRGAWLGEVLLERGVVARRRLEEIMTFKARESIFDCYEWDSGELEWRPGTCEVPKLALDLDLRQLHREALERRATWCNFWNAMGSRETTFEVSMSLLEGLASAEEIALARAAARGTPLAELLAQGVEGRLAAGQRLMHLFHQGVLVPHGATRDARSTERAMQLLSEAYGHFHAGRFEAAAAAAGRVLDHAPVPEAHTLFREAEARATQALDSELAHWDGRLQAKDFEHRGEDVTCEQLYLHARLSEGHPPSLVLRSAPMGQLHAHRAVRRLLDLGAVVLAPLSPV